MLRPIVLVGLALGFFARDPGCGGTEEKAGSVNAPCTRKNDCERSLRCTGGVCVDPNAAVDASSDAADAAIDDAGSDG